MRLERGLTKRAMVLEALRAIGLPVDDDDLTDKRGRLPKSGRKRVPRARLRFKARAVPVPRS
jgi:hypothetical protein